jgi:hypothetical protein
VEDGAGLLGRGLGLGASGSLLLGLSAAPLEPLLVSLRSVLVRKLEELGGSRLLKTVRELVDGGGDLRKEKKKISTFLRKYLK